MGVFGAMNAAVSGLTAQAYALENISGNIANSATTGYKRLDTSFADLVGGGSGRQQGQIAGTVNASSRATNSVRGDLQKVDVETYMAINGEGYFVVQSKTGDVDGRTLFSGDNVYTRRGDFEFDKEGNLVNGSGYYLMGQPIDPVTNNVSGSVPGIITLDTSVMPAVVTDRISYEGNLPSTPMTNDYSTSGVDTLNPALITAGTANATITGAEEVNFLNSTIAGDAITVYNSNGSPVNVQMRWAKVADANDPSPSGNDEWAMYYLSDSDAGAADPKWTKVDDAQFDVDGILVSPAAGSMTITGLAVDGDVVGDVTVDFGTGNLTQFASANGSAKITRLTQNGFAAGELTGVSISEAGRIVAAYSNGRTRELYEVSLVSFAGEASLERLDGGAFAVTPESGPPIRGADGVILGKTLESSNTDIADEFSKLIITQQAYSANTRIITASDELLQETINMVR